MSLCEFGETLPSFQLTTRQNGFTREGISVVITKSSTSTHAAMTSGSWWRCKRAPSFNCRFPIANCRFGLGSSVSAIPYWNGRSEDQKPKTQDQIGTWQWEIGDNLN